MANVRPWDADAINFIFLSRKMGIDTLETFQILYDHNYCCDLGMVSQTVITAESFRPWDANTPNFIIGSAHIGMCSVQTFHLLKLKGYICSLEQVEETLINAGFMAWVPTYLPT